MNSYDEKNTGVINKETLQRIKSLRVLVVGVGGLGGHLANHLARLGVKSLHLIDFDVFQPSNINRQLFSSSSNLGKSKVQVVGDAVRSIREDVKVIVHESRIESIDKQIWKEVDIVMDAVDSIKMKQYLEDKAAEYGLPLIHGAVAGFYGQVGIIMPGSNVLKRLYDDQSKGLEAELGCPTFIPSIVAGMMISELVKFLQEDKNALINRIMMIDVANPDYQTITFIPDSKKGK
ncbi:MAG: ThiF family adenylyltransferase [Bacteroidia bacterium]|nr:ThiF family adenylyltransferase [Bacteroidia bacterium]